MDRPATNSNFIVDESYFKKNSEVDDKKALSGGCGSMEMALDTVFHEYRGQLWSIGSSQYCL